jgi:hypothetical protein
MYLLAMINDALFAIFLGSSMIIGGIYIPLGSRTDSARAIPHDDLCGFVYWRSAAHLLTRDASSLIAAKIAKLPELLGRPGALS